LLRGSGAKPLAFGQYRGPRPGFEQLLDQLAGLRWTNRPDTKEKAAQTQHLTGAWEGGLAVCGGGD
jgi:hypothetical protein